MSLYWLCTDEPQIEFDDDGDDDGDDDDDEEEERKGGRELSWNKWCQSHQ